jgi:hypothetical protein
LPFFFGSRTRTSVTPAKKPARIQPLERLELERLAVVEDDEPPAELGEVLERVGLERGSDRGELRESRRLERPRARAFELGP